MSFEKQFTMDPKFVLMKNQYGAFITLFKICWWSCADECGTAHTRIVQNLAKSNSKASNVNMTWQAIQDPRECCEDSDGDASATDHQRTQISMNFQKKPDNSVAARKTRESF